MTEIDIRAPAASRMAGNAAWVVAWRLSTRFLGLASTLALVRLLVPTDFGLIMLATTFTAAVDSLSSVGIQDAIVREKTPERSLYDTAFTMNALRCLATGSFIGAAAWPAASFFNEPRLAGVLLALALVTVAGAAENIRVVDFRRDLAFHREFKLLLLPRLAAIASSIAVAAVWHSYWALVVGLTTNRLLQLVLGYALRPYRPRLSLRDWRRIIGFSVWTWLSSLVVLVRDRSDNFVIGRVLGTTQVGLFSVGAELAALPTTDLVEPLCRVLFPGFAATRNAGGKLADVFFQTISVTSLVTMPAGIGISMVAGPMIALVFGSQWDAAVPVVATLAIAGTLKVIAYITGTLFTASGLLTSSFRIVVVSTIVRVTLLVAFVPRFGLLGGAVAILASVVVEELLFLAMSARKLGFPILELLRRMWRGLAATAAMAAALWLTGLGWSVSSAFPDNPGRQLLVAVPFGMTVYVVSLGVVWLLAGRPEGAEIQMMRMVAGSSRRVSGMLRRPGRVSQAR
jgi:lipopolysaccharide exporter